MRATTMCTSSPACSATRPRSPFTRPSTIRCCANSAGTCAGGALLGGGQREWDTFWVQWLEANDEIERERLDARVSASRAQA